MESIIVFFLLYILVSHWAKEIMFIDICCKNNNLHYLESYMATY